MVHLIFSQKLFTISHASNTLTEFIEFELFVLLFIHPLISKMGQSYKCNFVVKR